MPQAEAPANFRLTAMVTVAVIADCAADDKAIEVTRCSSSMAFTSTPVFGRLLCKLKTGPDLVGHRFSLMVDNPESVKTGGAQRRHALPTSHITCGAGRQRAYLGRLRP